MEHLKRLSTYVSWPAVSCRYSLLRLARAGFRYTGVADEILCDSCGLIIRDWSQREGPELDPVRQHSLRSPRCQLLSPSSATTPGGQAFTAEDNRSLRCNETQQASTWSTQLSLAAPAAPSANSNRMASGDPDTKTGDRSPTNHAAVGTASVDGIATGTRSGRRHAAEPGCCSTDSTSGSNKPDNEDEEHQLREKNRRLREAKTCKVCMDSDVNTVFLPCGHLVSCDQCAPRLRNCPVCRTYIRGTVKIVLS